MTVSKQKRGPAQCRTARGQQVCITWMRAYDTTAEAGTFNSPGRGAMFDTEDVGVFLGLDVGVDGHAVNR